MKLLFLLIAVLGYGIVFAQDSTEIKLQRYKDLHENGLITDIEYETLKKKELSLNAAPAKKDTVNLDKLKRSYKSSLVFGSVMFSGAIASIAGAIHLRTKPIYAGSNASAIGGTPTSPQFKGYHTRDARLLFVLGGVCTGVGIYAFVKGAKNRQKYIELSTSPGAVTMLMKF